LKVYVSHVHLDVVLWVLGPVIKINLKNL